MEECNKAKIKAKTSDNQAGLRHACSFRFPSVSLHPRTRLLLYSKDEAGTWLLRIGCCTAREDHTVFSAHAASQISFAQNIQYSKVLYFGIVCLESLHTPSSSIVFSALRKWSSHFLLSAPGNHYCLCGSVYSGYFLSMESYNIQFLGSGSFHMA